MKKQKLSKVKSVALDYAILIALAVMSIYYTMDARGFPTLENLTNILNQNSVYIILAVGQTLVILTAGIDLSVGSVLALSAVISADVAKHMDGYSYGMIPVASIAAVGVGGAVGAFNGAMVTVFKIPPFIATLAMMTIARGIANIYCNARPIGHLPAEFKLIGTATVGTVPLPVFIMAAIAAALFVITRYTVFGRYVYAVGGNEEAARLSGIDVAMTKFWVYVISGMCAGLCGLILAARLGSGDPKLGLMYELVSIAAVVLGGTSLFGGRGSVIGTIYGALFIGVLENGLLLKGVSTFYQWVIKGIVILIAVIIDELKRR